MKIALSGYYGFDNAGDEALLSAITSTIKKLEPTASFVVFSGYPGKTARLHGLRAVNRMNPWSVSREMRSSNLLISGGGSLFQDVTGPRSLPYYISIVAMALFFKKPVIFYAQGIGPINRRFSKFLMRLVANRVDVITLRDEDSLNLLQQIGVTRPPIKVTADPVFSLEPQDNDYREMKELLQNYCSGKGKVVGVSVRKWSALEGYQPELAQLLDELVRKGYQVLFIPLDYPADMEESMRVISLMEEPAALIDSYLTSHQNVALISHLHLMIGMRLHALIFAASQEVLFQGISYDPKVDALLKQFGQKPLQGNVQEMNQQVNDLLADEKAQQRLRQKARELRARAEETAHLALSLCQSTAKV